MIKKTIFPLFIALLMQGVVVEAQTGFTQSRYIDEPRSTRCSDCTVDIDGITHIRFDPASTKLIVDSGKNFVKFKVQIRATGGIDDARYISAAAFRLQYDNAVFGDRLGTAADGTVAHPNTDGSGDPAPQCTYERSDFFSPNANYSLAFNDTDPDVLNINERHALQAVLIKLAAPASQFLQLGKEWTDLVTLTCEIPAGETDNEAGFGVAGSQPRGIFYRRYTNNDPVNAAPTTAFLIADNDLRGFRLDGKTWAEDYVRYSDGTGVRVQFSKGIRDALTNTNFALHDVDPTDVVIASVTHTAGSRYANIKFDKAAVSGVLRLATSSTVATYDMSGRALGSDGFVASLHYDADAPVAAIEKVTGPDGNSISEWKITFNQEVRTDTINKDHLCITEANGVCAGPEVGSVISITETSFTGASTTTEVMMKVNEGGGKVGGMRSIEFRRNAVLGTDLKIVEDYQLALREKLLITDSKGAVITIVANNSGMATPDSSNPNIYRMSFTVSSDEPVATLGDSSSYQLMRVNHDGTVSAISSTFSSPVEVTENREYTINVEVMISNIADIQAIAGFTLARVGSSSLQDEASNNPIRGDDSAIAAGERIDENNAAIAARDDTDPVVRVTVLDDSVATPNSSDATQYSMRFSVQSNKDIRDIGLPSSYDLLRKKTDGTTVPLNSAASGVTSSDSVRNATVTYTNIDVGSLTDARETAGFILARSASTGNNQKFLDIYSNPPAGVAIGAAFDNTKVAERDTTAPKIAIEVGRGGKAEPQDGDSSMYDITFTVTADKDVPSLDVAASYDLIQIPRIGNPQVINAVPTITGDDRRVVLMYTVTLSDLSNVEGFTLARKGEDDLLDPSGNIPQSDVTGIDLGTGVTGRFDPNDDAIAITDATPPQIFVQAQGMAEAEGNGNTYSMTFVTTATEEVVGIGDKDTYRLIRIDTDDNERLVAVDAEATTTLTATSKATIRYTVTLADYETPHTKGFTLGLGKEGNLADLAGNSPQINGRDILPDKRIDPRSEAIAFRDTVAPVITVRAGGAVSRGESAYRMTFEVSSGEMVPDIRNIASYGLKQIPKDGGKEVILSGTTSFRIEGHTQANPTDAVVEVTYVFADEGNERNTKGFTLIREDDSLRDVARNAPVNTAGIPIPAGYPIAPFFPRTSQIVTSAIAMRDTDPPIITVNVLNEDQEAETTIVNTSTVIYTLRFQVTASEDTRNIENKDSYILFRNLAQPERKPDGTERYSEEFRAKPEVSRVSTDNKSVLIYKIEYKIEVDRNDAEKTAGFNLIVRNLQDLANNEAEYNYQVPLVQTKAMECAAFYPDIGQTELFLRIKGYGLGYGEEVKPADGVVVTVPPGFDLAIRREGFALSENDQMFTSYLSADQISQQPRSGNDNKDITIIKLDLREEIKDTEVIYIKYDPFEKSEADEKYRKVASRTAMCDGRLLAFDADNDGLLDIVDINPYVHWDDESTTNKVYLKAQSLNTNIATTEGLAEAPGLVEDTPYYSRTKIIRSVLRDEGFTYIDDEGVRQTFTNAIASTDYFGVEADSSAFSPSEDLAECSAVLNLATDSRKRGYQLTQVNAAKHCLDVTDSFGNAAIGTRDYVWAKVEGDRLSSGYMTMSSVKVVPEVEFVGQSSYFLAGNSKTVKIAAYVGSSDPGTIRFEVKSDPEGDASRADGTQYVSNNGAIEVDYEIANLMAGKTVTHWLVGAPNVWQPGGFTLAIHETGNHDLASIEYAIGSNNNIDLRSAGADEEVTEVHQIILYEATDSGPQRVTHLVTGGRTYYAVADYTTNADIEVQEMLPDGYEILTTTDAIIDTVTTAGHVVTTEHIDIIVFTVDEDIVEDDDVSMITVGWDNIGSVKDVKATYLVATKELSLYAYMATGDSSDADNDGIPRVRDVSSNSNKRLQTFAVGAIGSYGNYLVTADSQQLFVSDIGKIIAIGRGNTERSDWVAANIAYEHNNTHGHGVRFNRGLDKDALEEKEIAAYVRTALGFTESYDAEEEREGSDLIESIATFGVRGVNYAIGNNDELVGGVTYAVFPVELKEDTTYYLSKYDSEKEKWYRFERGDVDTWYAIDRDSSDRDPPDQPGLKSVCPENISLYKTRHKGSVNDGFAANTSSGNNWSCIMVAISDGGPYDNGEVDGIVVDPIGIGTYDFRARQVPRRGGGGGSIGMNDIVLLIGAFTLLLIASMIRRRKKIFVKTN